MPRNVLQEDLLHDFLERDQSEANQPVVPWVELLACSEDRCNICHSLTITDYICSLQPMMVKNSPTRISHSYLGALESSLPGPMGLPDSHSQVCLNMCSKPIHRPLKQATLNKSIMDRSYIII